LGFLPLLFIPYTYPYPSTLSFLYLSFHTFPILHIHLFPLISTLPILGLSLTPSVIAFCDTDASLKFVDVAIPTNNKSRHSIGLMWYLLCREVLRLRGTVPRGPMGPSGWDVLPDLFFYRDPEEIEKEAADKAAAQAAAEGGDADAAAAQAAGAVSSEWDAGQTADAVFNAQPTGNGE
jgi:hypothetical protein